MILANDEWMRDARRIYLIGIGGVGMSALAKVLKHQGLEVSGSDRMASPRTHELEREGIRVFIGQQEAHLEGTDLVIYSSAITQDHIELRSAYDKGLKVMHRAQILASLLNRAQTSVAVTGTHGKTTTAGMLAHVFSGSQPTCLVGGDILNVGTNTVLGGMNLWISEVDESDGSHEFYAPNYCICTNLEVDHIDYYKDLDQLETSFGRFLENVHNPGLVIYSAEDEVLCRLIEGEHRPAISCGFSDRADFQARNLVMTAFGSSFDLFEYGLFSGRFELSVPGRHNVSNALAVMALAVHLGMDDETLRTMLAGFRGTGRRLEVKGRGRDVVVVDDYAHHPTEVRAALAALKGMGSPVTVVFQPHRFSRTQFFYREFAEVLKEADRVILTEIYGAGEKNPDNTQTRLILEELESAGHTQAEILPREKVAESLLGNAELKGVVAFLGAGNIGEVADEVAGRLPACAQA